MSITILLADDHKIIRDGLHSLIEKQPDMEVVGEAEDGRSTLKLAKQLKPNVIVMDISMPELNGIDATRQILEVLPKTKVIALSMYSDTRFVVGMFKAGASGYLLKDCAFEEIVQAVNTVLSDQTFLSPKIATVVIDNVKQQETAATNNSAFTLLTSREREIIQLIAEGRSTKVIAYNLNLSVKTIESHRQNIMNKLEINNLADLIKFAIREGLTSLDQ